MVKITLKNWGGYEVFSEVVEAKTCSEALEKISDKLDINDGDILEFEELEA